MLKDLQHHLLAALLADDPVVALRDSLDAATDLTTEDRAWLKQIPPDGLILTGLLVKKLRFERLTRGESDLEEMFKNDPKAFMNLYRNYTGAVAPTAYFPQEEAELYRRWKKEDVSGER